MEVYLLLRLVKKEVKRIFLKGHGDSDSRHVLSSLPSSFLFLSFQPRVGVSRNRRVSNLLSGVVAPSRSLSLDTLKCPLPPPWTLSVLPTDLLPRLPPLLREFLSFHRVQNLSLWPSSCLTDSMNLALTQKVPERGGTDVEVLFQTTG